MVQGGLCNWEQWWMELSFMSDTFIKTMGSMDYAIGSSGGCSYQFVSKMLAGSLLELLAVCQRRI